ncbi:MAG: DUF721 domain-containing protein [Chlorobium sp.]
MTFHRGKNFVKSKSPRRLDAIVNEVCRGLGMEDERTQYRVLKIWSEIAGDIIDDITVAERLTEGRLYIRVKNSAWRMELNFRKKELAEKMNKILGKEKIQDIIFR